MKDMVRNFGRLDTIPPLPSWDRGEAFQLRHCCNAAQMRLANLMEQWAKQRAWTLRSMSRAYTLFALCGEGPFRKLNNLDILLRLINMLCGGSTYLYWACLPNFSAQPWHPVLPCDDNHFLFATQPPSFDFQAVSRYESLENHWRLQTALLHFVTMICTIRRKLKELDIRISFWSRLEDELYHHRPGYRTVLSVTPAAIGADTP